VRYHVETELESFIVPSTPRTRPTRRQRLAGPDRLDGILTGHSPRREHALGVWNILSPLFTIGGRRGQNRTRPSGPRRYRPLAVQGCMVASRDALEIAPPSHLLDGPLSQAR